MCQANPIQTGKSQAETTYCKKRRSNLVEKRGKSVEDGEERGNPNKEHKRIKDENFPKTQLEMLEIYPPIKKKLQLNQKHQKKEHDKYEKVRNNRSKKAIENGCLMENLNHNRNTI